jgi:hypothetical protein
VTEPQEPVQGSSVATRVELAQNLARIRTRVQQRESAQPSTHQAGGPAPSASPNQPVAA